MNYSENETDTNKEEDFSTCFMCSLGTPPNVIDIVTVAQKNINFDEAEKKSELHSISSEANLRFAPYDILKEIKLRSTRHKDLHDIARLEEIRNKK